MAWQALFPVLAVKGVGTTRGQCQLNHSKLYVKSTLPLALSHHIYVRLKTDYVNG